MDVLGISGLGLWVVEFGVWVLEFAFTVLGVLGFRVRV